MMVKQELLGFGIEETGCNLSDSAHDVEIETAQDIGLIDQVLTGIGIIGEDFYFLGVGEP